VTKGTVNPALEEDGLSTRYNRVKIPTTVAKLP
jgi:hypothetical protein